MMIAVHILTAHPGVFTLGPGCGCETCGVKKERNRGNSVDKKGDFFHQIVLVTEQYPEE
jgi:hypothetical protein